MDLPGITVTETEGQVFLRHLPVAGRAPVDAAMLHALLDEAGFGQCLHHEDAIASAAAECNTAQTPFVVQVAERRDASVQVEIAPDEMAVQVSLVPPLGGKPITLEDIQQALKDAGVVYGIDEAALVHACSVGQGENLPVASGAPPRKRPRHRVRPATHLHGKPRTQGGRQRPDRLPGTQRHSGGAPRRTPDAAHSPHPRSRRSHGQRP